MTSSTVPTAQERPTVSIDEACRMLGVSRTTAYEAAKTGQLPTIALGRRILVPTAALRHMLQLDGPDAA